MGIRLRIDRLLQATKDRETQGEILRAYKMLVGETTVDVDGNGGDGGGGMGSRFKAFALFPHTLERVLGARGGFPAGFFPIAPEEADDEDVATSLPNVET